MRRQLHSGWIYETTIKMRSGYFCLWLLCLKVKEVLADRCVDVFDENIVQSSPVIILNKSYTFKRLDHRQTDEKSFRVVVNSEGLKRYFWLLLDTEISSSRNTLPLLNKIVRFHIAYFHYCAQSQVWNRFCFWWTCDNNAHFRAFYET